MRKNGASLVFCCPLLVALHTWFCVLPVGAVEPASNEPAATHFKFDFGSGKETEGYLTVSPDMTFNAQRGYGFEPDFKIEAIDRNGPDTLRSDFITAEKPFYFSVALPEGNYQVTVVMGDQEAASNNTIKAETRRLMLEGIETKPGEFVTRTFLVNIRTPEIPGGERVKLNDDEKNLFHWDKKLTLEINGSRPCIAALEIEKVDDAVTVYLLGDSSVTDVPDEPYGSWGQYLPRFLKPGVAVANHAESGESFQTSLASNRVAKVFSTLKEWDYVFVLFGGNDQKSADPKNLENFKARFHAIVNDVGARKATPVLVTSNERMRGAIEPTLGPYPQTIRDVAAETGAALIDVNAQSVLMYKALGPKLRASFADFSHVNGFGGYNLARCVVDGIKANKLDLAKFIVDDHQPFDPNQPGDPEKFPVPPSPTRPETTKPLGS